MLRRIAGFVVTAILCVTCGTISFVAASNKSSVGSGTGINDIVPAFNEIGKIKAPGGTIAIETEKKTSDTEKMSINVQYPVIKGLKSKDTENKINMAFQALASSIENSGTQLAKDIPDGIKAQAELKYKITYNQHNILSVYFIGYLSGGGAHGDYLQNSYTFNLETGHEYSLKELFKENVQYIPVINSQIDKQAKEKGIMPESLPKSIDPNQKFYLKKDSLVIYFEDLPYALGTPEFEIPFTVFGGSIKIPDNN